MQKKNSKQKRKTQRYNKISLKSKDKTQTKEENNKSNNFKSQSITQKFTIQNTQQKTTTKLNKTWTKTVKEWCVDVEINTTDVVLFHLQVKVCFFCSFLQSDDKHGGRRAFVSCFYRPPSQQFLQPNLLPANFFLFLRLSCVMLRGRGAPRHHPVESRRCRLWFLHRAAKCAAL